MRAARFRKRADIEFCFGGRVSRIGERMFEQSVMQICPAPLPVIGTKPLLQTGVGSIETHQQNLVTFSQCGTFSRRAFAEQGVWMFEMINDVCRIGLDNDGGPGGA